MPLHARASFSPAGLKATQAYGLRFTFDFMLCMVRGYLNGAMRCPFWLVGQVKDMVIAITAGGT